MTYARYICAFASTEGWGDIPYTRAFASTEGWGDILYTHAFASTEGWGDILYTRTYMHKCIYAFASTRGGGGEEVSKTTQGTMWLPYLLYECSYVPEVHWYY